MYSNGRGYDPLDNPMQPHDDQGWVVPFTQSPVFRAPIFLTIESSRRDRTRYPYSNSFALKLPGSLQGVRAMELVSFWMPTLEVADAPQSNSFFLANGLFDNYSTNDRISHSTCTIQGRKIENFATDSTFTLTLPTAYGANAFAGSFVRFLSGPYAGIVREITASGAVTPNVSFTITFQPDLVGAGAASPLSANTNYEICTFDAYKGVVVNTTGPQVPILGNNASAVDDFYNGMIFEVTSGAQKGLKGVVIDYDGTTKELTLDYTDIDATTPSIIGESFVIRGDSSIALVNTTDYLSGYFEVTRNTIRLPLVTGFGVTTSEVDDFYVGRTLEVLNDASQGEIVTIVDYDGVSRTATVQPNWSTSAVDDDGTSGNLQSISDVAIEMRLGILGDSTYGNPLPGQTGNFTPQNVVTRHYKTMQAEKNTGAAEYDISAHSFAMLPYMNTEPLQRWERDNWRRVHFFTPEQNSLSELHFSLCDRHTVPLPLQKLVLDNNPELPNPETVLDNEDEWYAILMISCSQ